LRIIAHASDGKCIFSATEYTQFRLEIVVAESLAVRKALQMASTRGLHRIQVQSDCVELILAIHASPNTLSSLGVIAADISRLAHDFDVCVFIHVRRTTNLLADALARRAIVLGISEYWDDFCPIVLDCNSTPQ